MYVYSYVSTIINELISLQLLEKKLLIYDTILFLACNSESVVGIGDTAKWRQIHLDTRLWSRVFYTDNNFLMIFNQLIRLYVTE
jgi:hypothetical protein